MGIGIAQLELLISLKRGGHIPHHSSVVEVGAQQLDPSFLAAQNEIGEIGGLFGIGAPPTFSRNSFGTWENRLSGAPLAREFWTWLGFNYAAIDIDGSPESIPLDLNYDEVPAEHVGKYDLVTNLGTTEHVINQLQAFKIIHDLAAPEALMLHVLPSSGHFNHGLINYSAKFFWMLSQSNGYKVAFMSMENTKTGSVPENYIEYFSTYDRNIANHLANSRVDETTLVVALYKFYDMPFVAPIDVVAGTTVDHPVLRDRYWTVLKPEVSFYAMERDIRARVDAIYQREVQIAAVEHEIKELRSRAFLLLPRPLVKALQFLRRWSFRCSPQWLIGIKRRLFGVTRPQSQIANSSPPSIDQRPAFPKAPVRLPHLKPASATLRKAPGAIED